MVLADFSVCPVFARDPTFAAVQLKVTNDQMSC